MLAVRGYGWQAHALGSASALVSRGGCPPEPALPPLSFLAEAIRRSRHTITRGVGRPCRSSERLRLASQPITLSSAEAGSIEATAI